ncbi:unnamed protein product [Prorocentrum cordatum]|uniref:HEAT repeat-containing protein 1 n=1 Tax=Prorocentrum cordatum TaxID=2364126 RepID=A0ABN9TLF4_9DINO|nr:unnamed protein product [Polarella glacialis]
MPSSTPEPRPVCPSAGAGRRRLRRLLTTPPASPNRSPERRDPSQVLSPALWAPPTPPPLLRSPSTAAGGQRQRLPTTPPASPNRSPERGDPLQVPSPALRTPLQTPPLLRSPSAGAGIQRLQRLLTTPPASLNRSPVHQDTSQVLLPALRMPPLPTPPRPVPGLVSPSVGVGGQRLQRLLTTPPASPNRNNEQDPLHVLSPALRTPPPPTPPRRSCEAASRAARGPDRGACSKPCSAARSRPCSAALAVGLGLSEYSPGGDGSPPRDVLQEVARVFASCDWESATVANAVPRLVRLNAHFPTAFAEALLQCARVLLASVDARGLWARTSANLVELLAAAAAHAEASRDLEQDPPALGPLLTLVLEVLGGQDAVEAPRDRGTRLRGAELLWRLLAAAPADAGTAGAPAAAAAESVLLRLARDRVPQVRAAAALGLALLPSNEATGALALAAARDPSAKIRVTALAQLQMREGDLLDHKTLALLASRAADTSPAVRRRLFAALAPAAALSSQPWAARAESLGRLLSSGLRDCCREVRMECEATMRSWLSADHSSGGVLALVRSLGATGSPAQEAAAEVALQNLAEWPGWQDVASPLANALLRGAGALEPEEVLVARCAVIRDAADWGVPGDVLGAPVLKRALAAADAGHVFELRQILLVLLSARAADCAGNRQLLHVATAVLLRAPAERDGSDFVQAFAAAPRGRQAGGNASAEIFHLAVSLARRALGICPGRGVASQRLEGEFSDAMLVILQVLCGTPAEDGAPQPSQQGPESLEALGCRAQGALRRAREAAGELEALRASRQGLRCVGAPGLLVEANAAAAEATAAEVLAELGARLWRVLGIAEAVLSHSRRDVCEDFALSLLLEDVLRPALAHAEAAAAHDRGCAQWPRLRTLALRCVALHASMSADTAIQHWPFFVSVLASYVPAVLSPPPGDSDAALSVEQVVEQCILFLADALLVHREDDADVTRRLSELLSAMAPLLGARHAPRGQGPSSRLRGVLAQRLCTLLLYTSPGQLCAPGSAEALGLAGGLRWALAWLLMEAFLRPPEPPERRSDEAEAEEGAATRGCLLRFLCLLPRLSGGHLALLAAAAEGFLSLELWRLGALVRVGAGLRCCALSLPRLVRFLGRQIATAAGEGAGTAEERARLWQQSLWRPLALACLESAAVDSASSAELPQALLAALPVNSEGADAAAAVGPGSGAGCDVAELAWVPASMRSAFVSEVAWVLNRAVELWGWNSAAAGRGVDQLPQRLIRLRSALAPAAGLPQDVNWASEYVRADKARAQLREAVEGLGVDVVGILATVAVHTSEAAASSRQRRDNAGPSRGRRGAGPIAAANRLPFSLARPQGAKRAASRAPVGSSAARSKRLHLMPAVPPGPGPLGGREAARSDRPGSWQAPPALPPAAGGPAAASAPGPARQAGSAAALDAGVADLERQQREEWAELRREAYECSQRFRASVARVQAEAARRLEELAGVAAAAGEELEALGARERIEAADGVDQEAVRAVALQTRSLLLRARRELEAAVEICRRGVAGATSGGAVSAAGSAA